jgi:hypothetical protein
MAKKRRPKESGRVATRNELDGGRFQRDLFRMLMVFGAIALIDVAVVSCLTGKLRFWFPVWIDPSWETNPNAFVTYSQSYFAGIFFIPVLVRMVDREFLSNAGQAVRGVFWAVGLAAFAFILWWKGGLMVEHHKHLEGLGWAFLTIILWFGAVIAETVPRKVAAMSRMALLQKLLYGVAGFFLVMAVVDPVVQIAVQGLGWSTGLLIEVGFFIPAGIALFYVAQRMNRRVASGSARGRCADDSSPQALAE